MVLSLDYNKELTFKRINQNIHDFIIIDTGGLFEYKDDIKNLSDSIETLTLLKAVHNMNDFYKSLNSNLRIPTGIILKTIDAGITGEPLTPEQLTEYFNVSVQIESFIDKIRNFKTIDAFVPFEVEYSLFGLSYDGYNDFSNKQKERLNENYGELFFDVRNQKMSVPDFIAAVKDLIEKVKINEPLKEK